MRAVVLEFYYSTGETMAYQEARVFSPGSPRDDKNAFQSGRADEFGRCSFVPDAPGEWRVVLTDHEGHRAEAVVDISDEFFNGGGQDAAGTASGVVTSGQSLPQGRELFMRALLGVSVIFNIAALVWLARGRLNCT
jgi:nickel transport protein